MSDKQNLRKALRGSNVGIACVGAGALAFGAFMIALHALGLDPTAANAGPVGLALLYGFGFVFAVTGVLMLYVGLIKGRRRGAELLRIIERSPQQIARAYGTAFKTRGLENAPGGSYWIYVHLTNGTVHPVLVRHRDLEPLLQFIWQRAPHAARTATK